MIYIRALLKYNKSEYVFATINGEQFSTYRFRKRIKRYCRYADVYTTPYQLLHYFGTEYARNDNCNILYLQKILGHSKLEMTRRYVKIDCKFYEPYPKPMKPTFEREVCDGGYVSEYCQNSVKTLDNTLTNSQYYDILKKMVDGKNVVVRFSGSNGTKDLIIDKDKQAIREVLEAWDIIEELYGK